MIISNQLASQAVFPKPHQSFSTASNQISSLQFGYLRSTRQSDPFAIDTEAGRLRKEAKAKKVIHDKRQHRQREVAGIVGSLAFAVIGFLSLAQDHAHHHEEAASPPGILASADHHHGNENPWERSLDWANENVTNKLPSWAPGALLLAHGAYHFGVSTFIILAIVADHIKTKRRHNSSEVLDIAEMDHVNDELKETGVGYRIIKKNGEKTRVNLDEWLIKATEAIQELDNLDVQKLPNNHIIVSHNGKRITQRAFNKMVLRAQELLLALHLEIEPQAKPVNTFA